MNVSHSPIPNPYLDQSILENSRFFSPAENKKFEQAHHKSTLKKSSTAGKKSYYDKFMYDNNDNPQVRWNEDGTMSVRINPEDRKNFNLRNRKKMQQYPKQVPIGGSKSGDGKSGGGDKSIVDGSPNNTLSSTTQLSAPSNV